jgi:hypothetical protein
MRTVRPRQHAEIAQAVHAVGGFPGGGLSRLAISNQVDSQKKSRATNFADEVERSALPAEDRELAVGATFVGLRADAISGPAQTTARNFDPRFILGKPCQHAAILHLVRFAIFDRARGRSEINREIGHRCMRLPRHDD